MEEKKKPKRDELLVDRFLNLADHSNFYSSQAEKEEQEKWKRKTRKNFRMKRRRKE